MELIFTETQLQDRIQTLATEINNDYRTYNTDTPAVMVCVLNGAIHFFADLLKHIDIPCRYDFIQIKSYVGQDNSGGCQILKSFSLDLKGQVVYIIDDILDTGYTMFEAINLANDHMPRDVKTVTLFTRKQTSLKPDFTGFKLDSEFVVGYGLDNNGLDRQLRDIYSL
jgi:hypoxanthine phosphoribosyltransferase